MSILAAPVPAIAKSEIEEITIKANQGDLDAQVKLGSLYAAGKEVKADFQEAVKWWSKAAKAGNDVAQYNLGTAYLQGYGVKQDFKQAFYWFKLSAEQGLPFAQTNLASMYENGWGIARNHQKALEWYRKAAAKGDKVAIDYIEEQRVKSELFGSHDIKQYASIKEVMSDAKKGVAVAQFFLAAEYEVGEQIPKSYENALYWYTKAAEQGIPLAQINVGSFYLNGIGTKANKEEAIRWYKKAANQGNKTAARWVKELEQDSKK